MTVEEITKQLDAQDKLSSLTEEQKIAAEEAIKAGLDITNIKAEDLALETQKFAKQQEQQATLEKIQNQFMGIVATVGSELVPILETIAPILIMAFEPIGVAAKYLADMIGYLKENLDVAILLGGAYAVALGYQKRAIILKYKDIILERGKNALKMAGNLIESKGLLKGIAGMAINAAK